MAEFAIEDRTDWRRWVTPRLLQEKPGHRWYTFPHSFTSELVHALIEDWSLTPNDHVLDPFVGAGTTLLAAKEKGVPATGYDLSPLAVLATRAKIADYQAARLKELWSTLQSMTDLPCPDFDPENYPDLVRKALPGKLLGKFHNLDRAIGTLDATRTERDFFKLALLSTIREYSRAVPTGGWLRWLDRDQPAENIVASFDTHVGLMIDDVATDAACHEASWHTDQADARLLPETGPTYTAVITSPPYPNRHDYTRVFGVELMFGFMDWEQTRRLRYQSLCSHPEAHPQRPPVSGYHCPSLLSETITKLRNQEKDSRVIKMVEGYFLDLYLVLREIRRVCKQGARVALVLGNAQYRGLQIPVDELTAEIGEQAEMKCEKLIVVRYRGNSAQQMKEYGRRPSRESIVVFQRP